MRALVTGANGYIGSRLCAALLADGWSVDGLVRSPTGATHVPAKVHVHSSGEAPLDDVLGEATPDVIFHLAANPGTGRDGATAELIDDNISLGASLLDAMVKTPCRRFVNTGSYWEYADDGAYRPNTLYAATKRAFRDILHWYALHHQLSAATLVLFDVYGPGDWRPKLLTQLIAQLTPGRNARAFALTAGEQMLDLVHVSDVAAAYIRAAAALPAPGTTPPEWAVSSGVPMSLRQVVETLRDVSGARLQVDWGAKPYPPHQIFRPVAGLAPVPGWSAQVSLAAGLAGVIDLDLRQRPPSSETSRA